MKCLGEHLTLNKAQYVFSVRSNSSSVSKYYFSVAALHIITNLLALNNIHWISSWLCRSEVLVVLLRIQKIKIKVLGQAWFLLEALIYLCGACLEYWQTSITCPCGVEVLISGWDCSQMLWSVLRSLPHGVLKKEESPFHQIPHAPHL